MGLAANAGIGIGEGAFGEVAGVYFGRDADRAKRVTLQRGFDLGVREFTAEIGPVEIDHR